MYFLFTNNKKWIWTNSNSSIIVPSSIATVMSVTLMNNLIHRFNTREVAAAQEVGPLFVFNEKPVRYWRKDSYDNKGEFTESRQGMYFRDHVLYDENFFKMATDWVHENRYRKGKPNVMFCQWVNNKPLMNCNLHVALGFPCSSHHALPFSLDLLSIKKETFVDAHKRPDVHK